ncbi:MAG: ACT domain-containing protein [Actinomycetota bacterium]
MLEEINVIVDDEPGILAEIGELLGSAGVNIETLSASSHDGRGIINVVVDDGEDAAELLAQNGFKVEGSRAVLTATLDDRPGELGRYCRKLAESGVNISTAYLMKRGGGESELIFAVDNLELAQKV